MNSTRCPVLDKLPNTLNMSFLEKTSEPAQEALFQLIHHSSPDSATRTATTAALVLSLWQMQANILTQHAPSLILLNAGEAAPDPIDTFIAKVTSEQADKSTCRKTSKIDPEQAPQFMASAIHARQKLGYSAKLYHLDERSASAWEALYQKAKAVGFGNGITRPYANAWHDDFGLLTNEKNILIARLNEGPDRVAFRRDVLEAPNKVRVPFGFGNSLLEIPKKLAVSGSLTVDLWDEEVVLGIINLGLPILFIPHTAKLPLSLPTPSALDVFPSLWCEADVSAAHTSLMLPPIDWFESHADNIRRRLHLLPGPGNYEFAVLQVLHQLGHVCWQIANHAGRNHRAKPEHTQALLLDLHARALRGIALGVAALAWHGLGFDAGCAREQAVKVLRGLRAKGPMSRNEIRRNYHIESKEQRDILVERLAAEDLVQIEGNTVTALSFEEFVAALQSRPELAEAANFRKAADS